MQKCNCINSAQKKLLMHRLNVYLNSKPAESYHELNNLVRLFDTIKYFDESQDKRHASI